MQLCESLLHTQVTLCDRLNSGLKRSHPFSFESLYYCQKGSERVSNTPTEWHLALSASERKQSALFKFGIAKVCHLQLLETESCLYCKTACSSLVGGGIAEAWLLRIVGSFEKNIQPAWGWKTQSFCKQFLSSFRDNFTNDVKNLEKNKTILSLWLISISYEVSSLEQFPFFHPFNRISSYRKD